MWKKEMQMHEIRIQLSHFSSVYRIPVRTPMKVYTIFSCVRQDFSIVFKDKYIIFGFDFVNIL